ncbi:MAG: GNAT family N-acetyltransferase [Trueperaceae bacterium]
MTAGPEFTIRPYASEDLDSVYRVCLLTGDSGDDASELYDDPWALGHLYAGPYVTLEPELAFVLEDRDGLCGYVLGAADTRRFHRRMVESWLPPLQLALPEPHGDERQWSRTARIYYRLHHPELVYPEALEPYPSHLHIDLLPRCQGRGNGRRLMERLLEALVELWSPGVHLGVGSANRRAHGFYEAMRFVELFRQGDDGHQSIYLGRRLP